MAENKKSFLLYLDIIHTVKKLPKDKAGELFMTILEYVNDMDPEITDVSVDLVFEPIKQSLKRDLEKYRNICKRNQTNGSKGGRPTKEITTISGKAIPEFQDGVHFIYLLYDTDLQLYKIGETRDLLKRRLTIKRPTEFLEIIDFRLYDVETCCYLEKYILHKWSQLRTSGDWFNLTDGDVSCIVDCIAKKPSGKIINPKIPKKPDSVSDIGIDSEKEIEIKVKKRVSKFSKPSIDEVKEYCKERKNSVNPQVWYDHYESNGWMVGKNKMKNWKAAVRTWENNNFGPVGGKSPESTKYDRNIKDFGKNGSDERTGQQSIKDIIKNI